MPLPWSGQAPPFGFSPDGVSTWLPMPTAWRDLTVAAQEGDAASMLTLHRRTLALRRSEPSMRGGTVTWLADAGADDRAIRLGRHVVGGRPLAVVTNFGTEPISLPAGEVLLASVEGPLDGGLPGEATVIIAVTDSEHPPQ